MMTSIAHLAVTCKDMKESLRFYTEALGAKKAFEISNPVTGNPWIIYMAFDGGQFIELFLSINPVMSADCLLTCAPDSLTP